MVDNINRTTTMRVVPKMVAVVGNAVVEATEEEEAVNNNNVEANSREDPVEVVK